MSPNLIFFQNHASFTWFFFHISIDIYIKIWSKSISFFSPVEKYSTVVGDWDLMVNQTFWMFLKRSLLSFLIHPSTYTLCPILNFACERCDIGHVIKKFVQNSCYLHSNERFSERNIIIWGFCVTEQWKLSKDCQAKLSKTEKCLTEWWPGLLSFRARGAVNDISLGWCALVHKAAEQQFVHERRLIRM